MENYIFFPILYVNKIIYVLYDLYVPIMKHAFCFLTYVLIGTNYPIKNSYYLQ